MRRLLDLATIACLGLALALLAAPLAGLDRHVVTGGSMGHSIPLGSLVLDRTVDAAAVKPGDVITFPRPDGGGPVTHRVVARTAHGLTTRGDANDTTDPWTLPAHGRVERVVAHVPDVGRLVAVLGPLAPLLLISIPCLLGAVMLVRGRPRSVPA